MEDKRAQYAEDEIITLEFDDGSSFDCGIMGVFDLDEKQYNPGGIRNAISNAKNQMLGPMAFEAQASDFYQKKVAEVYKGYQKLLRENNALDFDDLLLVTVSL